MAEFIEIAAVVWQGLGWPLVRLTFFVSIGIIVGNFIEALNWTSRMAKLAGPLIRVGHLSNVSGASFSLAFFSGVSGNTMLAEAYDQKRISKTELVLGNLFNSLPAYFLHLPTMFFITVPLIRGAAFVYVGLTLAAAFLRTLMVLVIGRILLPAREPAGIDRELQDPAPADWPTALKKAWVRFAKRMRKVMLLTVPIYASFFLLNRFGFFGFLEDIIARHFTVLSWLPPESIGVIVFQIVAEFTAGLAAAGVLLEAGTLSVREIVLALLVGNILSSPVRGFRHQFPLYAGIFNPSLAVELIACSQLFRVVSLAVVTTLYFLISRQA